MKTFKAGEKVRIAKGNNGHFFEEGTIVTLCEDVTEHTELFAAVNADGLRQVLEIEDIEPITSEFDLDDIEEFDFSELDDYDIDDDENEIDEPSLDVPAFKVGDKVRVITDNPYYGWGNVRKGDVGTIIAIDGKVIRVNFPGHSRWNGRADEFELVKEAEVRFKVGDIVKGKSGAERYRITNESMTRAEVIDVFEDRMIIRVLEHKSHPNFVGGEFSVEMEYFELVEDGDAAFTEKRITDKTEVKVGDKIKLVGNVGNPYLTKGKIYEVAFIDSFGDPYILDDEGDEWDTCGDIGEFVLVSSEKSLAERLIESLTEEQKAMLRELLS